MIELTPRRSENPYEYRSAVIGLLVMICVALTQAQIVRAQEIRGEWSTPQDVSTSFSEGLDVYGVLICDPNQNLHMLWGKGHQNGSEIYYRTDAKGTLSDPNAVLAMSDPFALALSATVTQSTSTLHVVWQNAYVKGDVYYSSAPLAAAGDGRSWGKPRLMVPGADLATIRSDSSGSLHLIYGASDVEGYRNSVYHARSDDDGATWSESQLVYEVRSESPSYLMLWTAIDARDRIHIGITIRTQTYGVYSELGYMRSLDGGYTWQPYQAIVKQSESTPNVSVIAPFTFGEDEIHLTWHDPRRMHMWSNDGGTTWSTPVQIIEMGAGFGGANYLAKDSAGVLRAATGVKDGIYVSTFAGSQWLTPEQIEGRSMDPHGQQLVVCQGNQLHVVYDDRVVEDTTVWYSHRQVAAPHLAQSPLPTSERPVAQAATSGPSKSPPQTPESTLTANDPTPGSSSAAQAGSLSSPTPPLLIATGSVLIFLMTALIWIRIRGHRF